MEISLETMIYKHAKCVAALENHKNCQSCRHASKEQTDAPCSDCYNILLGMPVNPTNWEGKCNDERMCSNCFSGQGDCLTEQDERYDCPIHGKQDGPDCPRC